MLLGDLLEAERRHVDHALARIAEDDIGEGAGGLSEPLRYAVAGGGKRLRAVLCVLAHRAVGGNAGEPLYDVACALELVHTYSLVHDDLPCMDDDDLRRGRPTLHRVFGSQTAVVTGAALIPLAFRILRRGARILNLDGEAERALVRSLACGIGAGGMVGGQWLDLEGESGVAGLAQLSAIHHAKTGALFRAALELGAISARASAGAVAACGEFGQALGFAFQVTDDILDETADSAALGKTAGKDRQQHKATYPALLGLDGAGRHARDAIEAGLHRLAAADITSLELRALGEWVLARDH